MLRVFLPYAIFETVLIHYYDDFDIAEYLLDISCVKPRYWYMCILLLCYLIFWITSVNANIYRLRYYILGGMSIGIFALGDMVGIHSEQAVSFMIGVLISDYKDGKKFQQIMIGKTALVASFALSILLLAAKQLPMLRELDGTYFWTALQMCMKTAMAVFVILMSYRWSRPFNNKMLIWIGSVSLEIYLVHYRMLRIFEFEQSTILLMILFAVGSFMGAWIFNLGIKTLAKVEKGISRY